MKSCKILVMGNTNVGKSTFLNNLIGCGTYIEY
jgi:GTPase Era involved in 16S rRNA processing